MGKEHISRVYEILPEQLALDERHVLMVLAESTADNRTGFAHRRSEIAARVGFPGEHPARLLASRLKAIREAGFIKEKREKNHHGMWTGRIYVELTIDEGTRTPRGLAAAQAKSSPVSRDDTGRFHKPSLTEDGHAPSPTVDGKGPPSTVSHGPPSTVPDAKPSTAATVKPSTVPHGGESPDSQC